MIIVHRKNQDVVSKNLVKSYWYLTSYFNLTFFFSFDRTDEDVSAQDSAAVIIRRNSQETSSENLVKPQQEEEEEVEGGPQNSQKNSKTASLPSVEQYNEQKKGRNPYHCVPCKKNFARSSLSSHVKSKHRGKSPKVKCGLCDKVFDKAAKAQDHVSSTHKVYPCPHNGNSNLTGARKGEATGHFFLYVKRNTVDFENYAAPQIHECPTEVKKFLEQLLLFPFS